MPKTMHANKVHALQNNFFFLTTEWLGNPGCRQAKEIMVWLHKTTREEAFPDYLTTSILQLVTTEHLCYNCLYVITTMICRYSDH